jgi:uncharacterized protein (TIGR02266 family)
MEQGRGTKRYATNQELLVRCDSWDEFVALYATDVGQGGMFVTTDDPPPVLSEVEVQLRLPEGHQIRLRARVVHVIEPAQAVHARREPGVGLEFVGLDAPARTQIHQLVEFARWQGTSSSPTATFASHMFEMNASAPPASVLASLPPALTTEDSSRSGVRRASSAPAGSDQPNSGRARSISSGSMPAVVPPGASAAPKKRKKSSAPPQTEGQAAAQDSQPVAAAPAVPPKPTDMEELKVGMTHLARKRFPEAVKHFQQMLANNPGDPEAGKWLHITNARRALASNDEKAAKLAYEKALTISEDVLEARKFVREMEQRKKLEAIPFGRYFMKKK